VGWGGWGLGGAVPELGLLGPGAVGVAVRVLDLDCQVAGARSERLGKEVGGLV